MAENNEANNSGNGGSDADLIKKMDTDLAKALDANTGRIENGQNDAKKGESDADKDNGGSGNGDDKGDEGKDKKLDTSKKEDDKDEDDDDIEDDDDEDLEDEDDDEEEDEDTDDEDDSDEEDEDEEDDKSKNKSKAKRPKTYIPVKQYQDDKKKWKQREADLLKMVEDAKKGKNTGDRLKAYAEKYELNPDSVAELRDILRDELRGDSDISVIKKAEEIAHQQIEKDHFEKEFKSVSPKIKEMYPDASDEQLEVIKEKLYEIGHSKWGHKYELDYILFKKKDEIDSVVSKPQQKGSKAPAEKGSLGKGKVQSITAASFKGKSDFSELAKLGQEEQRAIIKDMDDDTYINYGKWVEYNEGGGLTVRRQGQIIKLKN